MGRFRCGLGFSRWRRTGDGLGRCRGLGCSRILEKNWKAKLKLVENKIKENNIKPTQNDEKLKLKIHNQERIIELLKLKNVELEKKLLQEKEACESLRQNTKVLNKKLLGLEKILKEWGTQTNQSGFNNEGKFFDDKDESVDIKDGKFNIERRINSKDEKENANINRINAGDFKFEDKGKESIVLTENKL